MKNKIYNISHICFLMLISCFLLGSCMSDTINLDPDKIQEEELDKDNLWGSYLTTMQRRVVPEDVNLFQRSEDLLVICILDILQERRTGEGEQMVLLTLFLMNGRMLLLKVRLWNFCLLGIFCVRKWILHLFFLLLVKL